MLNELFAPLTKGFQIFRRKVVNIIEANISNPDLSVEIMYEVGFSNLSYFAKCFKSEFSVTPKEYQQKESKHNIYIPKDLQS